MLHALFFAQLGATSFNKDIFYVDISAHSYNNIVIDLSNIFLQEKLLCFLLKFKIISFIFNIFRLMIDATYRTKHKNKTYYFIVRCI